MAKSIIKSTENEKEEVSKTSVYLKRLSHQKLKYLDLKGQGNVNTLIQTAVDELIEKWEKKNGPISL